MSDTLSDALSYQPLLRGQRPEAAHGLFDDAGLLQVGVIRCDALPVLLQPQLEARRRPAATSQPGQRPSEVERLRGVWRRQRSPLVFNVVCGGGRRRDVRLARGRLGAVRLIGRLRPGHLQQSGLSLDPTFEPR